MNYFVSVPVKPYVRRFLENNYGSPVDFRNHPRENEMFRRMLKKPCYDNEHKYRNKSTKHTTTVDIVVSERDFSRHGWEITKTDMVSLGRYFERNAKLLMRSVVSTYISFGIPVNVAINTFQNRFAMEEEYWTFDGIKKDFFRYKVKNRIDFNRFAFQHLENLVLVNIANAGVITREAMNNLKTKNHNSELILL